MSISVPIDFISPMSFLRLMISNDILLDTTAIPIMKTSNNVAQMNVSKKTLRTPAKPVEVTVVVTSNSTLENKKRKVVLAITVVNEINTIVVLNGRRFRS